MTFHLVTTVMARDERYGDIYNERTPHRTSRYPPPPAYPTTFYPYPLTLGPFTPGNPNTISGIEKNNKTDDEVQPAACFVLREGEATSGAKPGRIPVRVSKLSREIVVACTGPPVRQRERNIYVTLGSGTYVVMCAAFMAGMEGSFKVFIVIVPILGRP